MSFLFETLNVYQMALEFHLKIVDLCQSDSFRGYSHLTDQFKRASLSISLNIAEGNGRFHKKDRKNFYYIARGSTFECIPLISLCEKSKRISHQEAELLKADVEEISRMLSGLIKKELQK